jgi:hypothetical protein
MAKEEPADKLKEKAVEEFYRSKKWHCPHRGFMGGGVYFFAMIGVAVYYIQQVSGFWPIVLAILKAIVWPAFLLYKVFTLLHM